MLGGGSGTLTAGSIGVDISADYKDDDLDRLKRDLEAAEKAAKGLDKEMDEVNGRFRDSAGRLREANGQYVKGADAVDKYGRASKKSSRFSGALKAGALGAAAAVGGGLVIALKQSVEEAIEAQKAAAQTAAVIKSTGGAANVSAEELGRLTTSLSNKTAMDDEAIQSGANLLLTFKDIKNEAGDGNDIFSQATSTMLDMSVAMGQSVKSSAIQLGKALNDPIKGVSALGRVGVQFTEQQKSQIETLVESGQKMKAQKMILKELQSQFAGSAEGAANPMERLQTIFNNLLEEVGLKLLPVIEKAATALGDFLLEFMNGTGTGGEFKEVLMNLGEVLKNMWPTIKLVGQALGAVLKVFASLPAPVQTALLSLGGIALLASKFGGIIAIVMKMKNAFTLLFTVLRMAPVAMGPIGLAIMALVTIGYLVIKNWKTIKEQLLITWGLLKEGARKLADVVVEAAKRGFLGPIPFILANWKAIKQFFVELPNKIKDAFAGLGKAIASPFVWAYKKIKAALEGIKNAFNDMKDTVGDIGGGIGDVAGDVGGFLVPGLASGGKVGPGAGGPQMFVAGEGSKPEWVISKEGPRKKNIGYALEALKELGVKFFANGGRVRAGETRLARAELTKPLGDDLAAAQNLKGLYQNSVNVLDRKLRKDGDGKDWFDRNFSRKKARARRSAALDARLSDLGSLKQYTDMVKSLRSDMRPQTGDSTGGGLAEQINSFNAEKMSLLGTFAGNVRDRIQTATSVAGAGAPAAAVAGAGKVVNLSVTTTEPLKDPHPWGREVQHELNALDV